MRASVGPLAESLNASFMTGNVVRSNLPDTTYDYTKPWFNNANDRVAYERAFVSGSFEDKQMAQAMLTSLPSTTDAEITLKMTVSSAPDRFGYNRQEMGIRDIVNNDFGFPGHVDDSHTTDFSGRVSNIESTSRPGIFW